MPTIDLGKINFILSPSAPTQEGAGQKDPRALCELAAVIRGHNSRIADAIGIINNMEQRCEL